MTSHQETGMEVDVGEHCFFPQCNRLDFLPFVCDLCHQTFCKYHRVPSSHNYEHIDTNIISTLPEKQEFLFHCSLPSCKKRHVTSVVCESCEQSYCIQHRHQEDHSCPALIVAEQHSTRTVRGRPLGQPAKATGTSGVKGGSSSKHTSGKVALMKLKMRAVGLDSIPQVCSGVVAGEVDRVYFEVELPRTSGLPNTSMFVSKEWCVGRTVDYIAQRFKLKNDNHKAHAQKLCLYCEGAVLGMSHKLQDLVHTVITGA
ncbi:AN1-type zinc finger protein 1-like isoform X1 [Halichondria panicea]|uniref:AN1-type zinc finger protein 1-like isoform X1 n=1 Tax=Halichondria panicea TaxID=6063 RepID=UPI00312BC6EE